MYFNQYLADTDITNTDSLTDMADTDIQFADTDVSVSVSVEYIS
jgi:hypothetical protein